MDDLPRHHCIIVTSVLVIAGFLQPLAGVTDGAHVAGLLVGAMLMLTAAIFFFLAEVLVSASSLKLDDEL